MLVSSELPPFQKLEIPDFGVIGASATSLGTLLRKEGNLFEKRVTDAWYSLLPKLQQANVKRGFLGVGRRCVLGKEEIEAMEAAVKGIYPDAIGELYLALGGRDRIIDEKIKLPGRVLTALDNLVAETHRFTVFTSLTPLGYNFSEERWEDTVLGLRETQILGGILYKKVETIPVEISGSREERGLTEHPTFIPANLPEGTRAELAKQVSLAYNNFTGQLGQLVSVFKPFTNPGEVNPHIANDVAVINYSFPLLIEKAREPQSTMFATTLRTCLTSLRQELTPQMEGIEGTWKSVKPYNFNSFSRHHLSNFLYEIGFNLKYYPNDIDVKLAQKRVPRQEYLALQSPRQ